MMEEAARIKSELQNLRLAAGDLVDSVTDDGVRQLAFVLDRIDFLITLVEGQS